jgi:tetratricopeptide (TPR) repeat protein
MSRWRNVRVFLSSTFRDMHAERDYLIKFTFPALRERLLPYRIEIYDIDLRWGITEDEAKNEQVISLCLEQVDQCRPFFLAFLGHRYGWVPPAIPGDTQARFPFTQRFPGASVTELELRHGILNSDPTPRALVLLRSSDTLDTIPKAIRNRDFTENDPSLNQQLQRLKEDLQASPFPVQPYSAQWNAKVYDRVDRSWGKLDGLKEFGEKVLDWLWQAIREELDLPESPPEIDPLEAEADLHERFLELRTRLYFGRDDLYRQLKQFALDRGSKPLLLTGPSGLGKSAALARFARDIRKEHPDVMVLAHFVGASPHTTSLATMLQRLTNELQRRFEITLPEAQSPDEIICNFITAILSVPEDMHVVILLDALNQLESDQRAETLIWLPEQLPKNVRILCSAATGPQKEPKVLSAFGEREYQRLEIQPLAEAERRQIIRAAPKLVAKALDEKQIETLIANPATKNPLFLMVALEELRGYGSYENLNALIGRLPREGDAVTALFEQVFQRLEKEFGKELVESTLTLLACARRGLTGQEILELTEGDQADREVFPLLRQLEPYLQRRAGRYDFYHTSVRRAVERLYLQWDREEDQNDPWLRWQVDRQPPASDPSGPEMNTRGRLVGYFGKDRLSERSIDELPWQLAHLRDWPQLFDLLGDLNFFGRAYEANEWEVRETWSLVKHAGRLNPLDAYQDVLECPGDSEVGHLWQLAHYLTTAGEGRIAFNLFSNLIVRFRSLEDDAKLQGILGNQAVILMREGDLSGAMALLREQESVCRRLNNPIGLSISLGNQGVILKAQGQLSSAMALHKEEEAICRLLNKFDGLSNSLGNQALILQSLGDYAGAMALHKEEEAICRRLNNPDGLAASLGNQAVIFRAQGDLSGAMTLLKKQEAICRRFNNPDGLQAILGNRALILKAQGDLSGAMALHKEEEAICRRLNDPAGLRGSLGGQALILSAQGDLSGAMALHKEEESICRRLNDPHGLQICLGNQALILRAQGDPAGAMVLHKEEESICRRLNNPEGLQRTLGNQALILRAQGDLSGAMARFKEQESICRRLNHLEGLQLSLGNQALMLQDSGDLSGAMALHKQEESICRQMNNPDGLQKSLGNQALILQAMRDLAGAIALLKEQELICRQINNPEGLAINLVNQGVQLVLEMNRPAEGLPLAEEALQLAKKHGYTALAKQIESIVQAIRARLV